MTISTINLAEEIQDFIAANSDLNLTVPSVGTAGNFVLGNLLNVDDLGSLLESQIVCSMFEEGGTLIRTGRRVQQERTYRFVFKGSYGQEAINLCHGLVGYLENLKSLSTATFSVWVLRFEKMPSVIAADHGGTHLADIVVTFLATNKTG